MWLRCGIHTSSYREICTAVYSMPFENGDSAEQKYLSSDGGTVKAFTLSEIRGRRRRHSQSGRERHTEGELTLGAGVTHKSRLCRAHLGGGLSESELGE